MHCLYVICAAHVGDVGLSHIFSADGKGEGFGNPISIQTVAIVKAAKAVGWVCSVDSGRPVS